MATEKPTRAAIFASPSSRRSATDNDPTHSGSGRRGCSRLHQRRTHSEDTDAARAGQPFARGGIDRVGADRAVHLPERLRGVDDQREAQIPAHAAPFRPAAAPRRGDWRRRSGGPDRAARRPTWPRLPPPRPGRRRRSAASDSRSRAGPSGPGWVRTRREDRPTFGHLTANWTATHPARAATRW